MLLWSFPTVLKYCSIISGCVEVCYRTWLADFKSSPIAVAGQPFMFNTSTQSECVDWTFSDQQRLTGWCKCSNTDRPTHPKRLGEGSGAAVQWVRDGDQCGFLPATWCAVLIIVLPQKKQVWLSAVSRVTLNPGRSYTTFTCFWLCLWPTAPL